MPGTGSSWTASMQAHMAFAAGSWLHRKEYSIKSCTKTGKEKTWKDRRQKWERINNFSLCQREELHRWSGKSRVSEKTFPKRQKSNKTAKFPLISLKPGILIHLLYTFGGLVGKKSPKQYFSVCLIHLQYTPVTVTMEREGNKMPFSFLIQLVAV